MDPETLGGSGDCRVKTEPFRDMLAVTWFTPSAPPDPEQDERQGKPPEKGIQVTHDGFS